MKPLLRPLAAALLLTALPGCSGCDEPDDEQQIRALIAEAVAAAERNDLGGLMELATDDFAVEPGGESRQEVKGVLLMAFRRYGRFTVAHPAPSVAVAEDRTSATAELPFLVVREGEAAPDLGGLVDDPERWFEGVAEMGDTFYLKLRLEKTDDGWGAARARLRGTRSRWSL
jgi:hypothetical protein